MTTALGEDSVQRLRELSDLAARLRSQRLKDPSESVSSENVLLKNVPLKNDPSAETSSQRIKELENENAVLRSKYHKALELLARYRLLAEGAVSSSQPLVLSKGVKEVACNSCPVEVPSVSAEPSNLLSRYMANHREKDLGTCTRQTERAALLNLAETMNSSEFSKKLSEHPPVEEISALLKKCSKGARRGAF